MNCVNLTGRIASLKTFEKCTFITVATPQKNNYKEADFVDCVAFGTTGGFIEKYFEIGQFIEIAGHITKTEHNGEYRTKVVIDNASFCGEMRPPKVPA